MGLLMTRYLGPSLTACTNWSDMLPRDLFWPRAGIERTVVLSLMYTTTHAARNAQTESKQAAGIHCRYLVGRKSPSLYTQSSNDLDHMKPDQLTYMTTWTCPCAILLTHHQLITTTNTTVAPSSTISKAGYRPLTVCSSMTTSLSLGLIAPPFSGEPPLPPAQHQRPTTIHSLFNT
jgi:hypothetical protein